MAVRIKDPQLDSTSKLLEQVLVPMIRDNQRVMFLAPPGEGRAILQRLRVMITRQRNDMRARGKKIRRFRLRSTIHRETHDGKRYDACVCWHEISTQTLMSEMLEDMLES